MDKISKKAMRRIVREEVQRLSEDVDHAGIVTVTRGAGDLLKAVNSFNEKATIPMQNALAAVIPTITTALEQMLQTPGSYVNLAGKKVVKLRSQSGKD